jgi:AraC-like DNA-binding protein
MFKHEIISPIGELPVNFRIDKTSHALVPSHWHQHVEVIYVLKGSIDIVMNHATYTIQEKDMLVINSGFIHLTKTLETTAIILLQIPYELLQQSVSRLQQIEFVEFYPYEQLKNNLSYTKMTHCLHQMKIIFSTKAIGYSFLFNSYLHQFLYELYVNFSCESNTLSLPSGNKHRLHLQKAINYIQLHYSEHISLSEIASHLALNPEYFSRMFKKNMGFTFLEYLNQIRLTHIYEDLIHTEDSITRIQERHGFTNYKVFNRMFKESYGMTPSMARKKG